MSRTRIKRKAPKSESDPKPKVVDVPVDKLRAIVDRAKPALSAEDHETLTVAVETLAYLTQQLGAKGVTIARLQRLLFGAKTEKTSALFGRAPPSSDAPAPQTPGDDGAATSDGGTGTDGGKEKPKRPGHGRNGAAAYVGARPVAVPHESLHVGDTCPACGKGKLYRLAQPATLIRVAAMAPLQATRFDLERLRCGACGEVFTAATPEGVGPDKYDETAAGMIGLLRYGSGLPFNRIARLERGFGIPLPPPTQWEVVARAAGLMAPAHQELIRQGAQGKVLHTDDTMMTVLDLMADARREADDADDRTPSAERTGIFTSGILAVTTDHQIALFFTGHRHAGENLQDVLDRRAAELPKPIQMCDALSANTTGELRTIVANCLAHARRGFVDVAENFPDECRHVLEELRKVYENDATTRKQEMSDDERLRFHQAHSRPVMDDLKAWMQAQLDERRVEPNSGLGEAIGYMNRHWPKLTLFLEQPGAPLDNTAVERALKKAICHRKNSLFYKTLNGAHVGDLFMSLIYTCELNGADPFDYLVALQRHHDRVAETPADWMPWNYRDTVARLTAEPGPPR